MEVLTLLLILFTVLGHSHAFQAGPRSAHFTEMGDALLAGNKEEKPKGNISAEWLENGQSHNYEAITDVNPDKLLESDEMLNEASEEGLTLEIGSIILGEKVESINIHSRDDSLNQRLIQEEQESMLIAGLHLERRNEDREKSLTKHELLKKDKEFKDDTTQSSSSRSLHLHHHNIRPISAIIPTHVLPDSSHVPSLDSSSSPVTSPNPSLVSAAAGDVKSVSFLEDLVTEVLHSPKHKSTMEVKAGQALEDVIMKNLTVRPGHNELQTTHRKDGLREINSSVGPDKGIFPYNTQAAMLNPTEVQATAETATVTSMGVESKFRAKANKGTKVNGKTPAKNNNAKKSTTEKMKAKKKVNNTQKESHFPYFADNFCPPECACYGRVVQCSDKGVDKVPYGIPYNSRYILLMNNHIGRIQLDLLNQYVSMEFLVLTNNRLTDGTVEGAFEGVPALKRLYLDRNLLQSVPGGFPVSLEELRLDNNQVSSMSKAAWAYCPGLLILSLSNNSLGNGSESLSNAVLSPLCKLQTLNLDHNQLTAVPLGLPLSIKELYLKGNRIEQFSGGAFNGKSELVVLDLSGNRLTNKGLLKDALLNASHLESLNLAGNRLTQVPQHLPASLKTLNLEGNLIKSIKKTAFGALKNLEHLGLARNKVFKVAAGAFRTLPALHQLDLCHNALRQVPRQLPPSLHSVTLTHNRIQSVPRDAFCWGNTSLSLSRLVRVQLENNQIDLGDLDTQAFRCLRGFQVVHFY